MPSRKLVETYRDYLAAGLAPPSAVQLHQKAELVASDKERLAGDILKLEKFLNIETSPFICLGMAHPQLSGTGPIARRVFVALLGLPSMKAEDWHKGKRHTFIDPLVVPVESEGTNSDIEYCFSALGIASRVDRWNVIDVQLPGRQPLRLTGLDARVVQHENDHIHGIICVDRSYRQGHSISYVPPEVKKLFSEYQKQGRVWPWPCRITQWQAMKLGDFSLEPYIPLLDW